MSPLKIVSYLPTVATPADLPDAASFEVGTGFWVRSEAAIYYSDGTVWVRKD